MSKKKHKNQVKKRIESRTKYVRNFRPAPGRLRCGLDKVPFEDIDILSHEEMIELYRNVQKGCMKSRDRLVMSVARFVLNRVVSYQCQSVPVEDLFQESMAELFGYVHQFDPSIGGLTTFAGWRVFKSVMSLFDNAEQSHFPEQYAKLSRIIDETLATQGIDPSDTPERIKVAETLVKDKHKAEKIACAKPCKVFVSNDACEEAKDDIRHSYEHEGFEIVDHREEVSKIHRAIETLEDEDRKVIDLFLAGKGIREGAELLGISKTAFQYRERRALIKLAEYCGTKPKLNLRRQGEFR